MNIGLNLIFERLNYILIIFSKRVKLLGLYIFYQIKFFVFENINFSYSLNKFKG